MKDAAVGSSSVRVSRSLRAVRVTWTEWCVCHQLIGTNYLELGGGYR